MSSPVVLDLFQPLGWTLLLALCQTTLIALCVRAWLAGRSRSSGRRHAVGYAALLASLVLAAGTYAGLKLAPGLAFADQVSSALHRMVAWPMPVAGTVPVTGGAGSAAQDGRVDAPAARERAATRGEASMNVLGALRHAAAPALPLAAAAWTLGAGFLLLRLAGGLLAVRRLRLRSRPLTEVHTSAVARLSERLGLAGVEWLQSAEIDAPAAVGWRHPAVLLPAGLHESMAPELLEPLLAHELAHVRRHDARKAALQGVADALLFFCPGARWLSAQVRLAREESCDDAAVAACGHREHCARALAALVGVQRSVPVLGAIGPGAPSLAARIRRLLTGEEERPRPTFVQATSVLVGVVASAAAVLVVGATALAARPSAPAAPAAAGVSGVPSAFVRQQPGAPLAISRVGRGDGFVFETVRVRNVSERRIVAVRFVALMEDRLRHAPVRVVETEPIAADLAPGEAVELQAALLSEAEAAAARAQPTLGIVEARFEDGDTWAVHLDRNARDADSALYLEKHGLVRALVGLAAPADARDCRDHRGFPYSQGFVTAVVDGPPDWARCVNGTWLACESVTSCPKLPSE